MLLSIRILNTIEKPLYAICVNDIIIDCCATPALAATALKNIANTIKQTPKLIEFVDNQEKVVKKEAICE